MRKWPLFAGLTVLAMLLAMLPVTVAHAGPALLFDPTNGAVLYSEDPDNQWHPASLTKIMTAYLTFEAVKNGKLQPDQKITISAEAARQEPSKLGLPPGSKITVDQAIRCLIIKSANDIAIALSEAVAGSEAEFVAQMNAAAQRLGMTRTTFVNPNGLPAAEQMTTARDLAKLTRAVINEYPQYQPYWAMEDMRLGKIRLATHNGLLKSFEGADGIKTGFICDSGYNMVASATRDGHRLIAVVLGEPTSAERNVKASSLLEHGFQQLGWKSLFSRSSLETLPVAEDAKAVASVRDTIVSCNPPQKPRKARAKGKKGKAPQPANGTAPAGQQKAGDTTPGASGASDTKPAAAVAAARPETQGPAERKPAAGAGFGLAP